MLYTRLASPVAMCMAIRRRYRRLSLLAFWHWQSFVHNIVLRLHLPHGAARFVCNSALLVLKLYQFIWGSTFYPDTVYNWNCRSAWLRLHYATRKTASQESCRLHETGKIEMANLVAGETNHLFTEHRQNKAVEISEFFYKVLWLSIKPRPNITVRITPLEYQ